MQARPDREAAIQLKAGESLFVYVKAGSAITSTSGELHLAGAPRWLGSQVFRTQARLAEGEALQIEERGWVTLTAAGCGSTVHICRVQASLNRMDWLRKTASMLVPGRTARTCA